MDLSQYASAAAVAPPDPPDTPTAGYPTAGNPGTGAAATTPGAYWFYQLQEELNAVVAAGGLTPDHTTLDQLATAIESLIASSSPALPAAALDYPTIATATNKLAVTPGIVAGQGGNVAIAVGTDIALAQQVVAGETGRMKMWTTTNWTSGNLAVSSTYYLRAKITTAGALQIYTQKGADGDAIPASLVGTVNGASGGGFDSTVFDMLIAKVVTGVADSLPTVTTLANAAHLVDVYVDDDVPTNPTGNIWVFLATQTLNWARTPTMYPVDGNIWATGGDGIINHANTVVTGEDSVSRYERSSGVQTEFDAPPTTPYGWIRLHTSA